MRYAGGAMKRYTPIILLVGDLLALFLFVFLGQVDHETVDQASPILGTLPNVLSFALPWIAAAWALGALPGADRLRQAGAGKPLPTLRFLLARSLNAWLVAAPLGMVLRGLWLGRGAIPIPFFLVTLAVGGAFLLGWRLLFTVTWTRSGAAQQAVEA